MNAIVAVPSGDGGVEVELEQPVNIGKAAPDKPAVPANASAPPMNRLRPNCDEAKAAAFAIRRFSAATFPSPTAKLHATHILKSPVQVSTLLTIDMVNLQRNHLKGLVSNKLPWDASLYPVDAPRQEPILLSHKDRTSSSLRLRYFDPRDLTSDGLYRSRATALANAELGYRLHERWRLSTEFLNLLNRCDHDIDNACTSRITPTATSAFTQVFHPGSRSQVRSALETTLLSSK